MASDFEPITFVDGRMGGTPVNAENLNEIQARMKAALDSVGSGAEIFDDLPQAPPGAFDAVTTPGRFLVLLENMTGGPGWTGTNAFLDVLTLDTGVVAQILTADGDARIARRHRFGGVWTSWAAVGAGGSAPDATSSVKGVLQLAGDLGGTAAAPTVPGLAGKASTTSVTSAISTAAADATTKANAAQAAAVQRANHTGTQAPSTIAGTAVVAADLAANATADRARANHTGTQAASTIAGTAVTGVEIANPAVRYSRLPKGCYSAIAWAANTAEVEREMRDLVSLGVETIRLPLNWGYIEYAQGSYDWWPDTFIDQAAQMGMRVILTLETTPEWARIGGAGNTNPEQQPNVSDYPDLAAFAGVAAARYKGKVHGYVVWNEPNESNYWNGIPSGAAYGALLAAVAPSIRAADPDALICTAGVSNAPHGNSTQADQFLTALFGVSGIGQHFDAVGFHSYARAGTAPDVISGASSTVAMKDFRSYELIKAVMDTAGVNKPMWLNEFGWTTAPTTWNQGTGTPWVTGVTEAQQAAYIRRAMEMLDRTPYIAQALLFHYRDLIAGPATSGSDPTAFFGIYTVDGVAKPAAAAFRRRPAAGTQQEPVIGGGVADDLDQVTGVDPSQGTPVFGRTLINPNVTITMTSGTMRLSYFKARRNHYVGTFRICGNAAFASTAPTKMRLALYTVEADGTLALAHPATTHDSTLFSTAKRISDVPFPGTGAHLGDGYIPLQRGKWYAVGILVVTAGTAPTIFGGSVADTLTLPKLGAAVTGLSEIPSTVSTAAQVVSDLRPYALLF